MTQLEAHQRGLLDLIKSRGDPSDDPYLRRVAGSRELAMMREIAVWWRALQLETQCYFTSRLLKRLGCFDELIVTYFNRNATSPFVEELSRDFLAWLCSQQDPLIHAVSQFEHAFLEARAGSEEAFEVLWDRHPDLVFRALEDGGNLPVPEPGHVYRMRIDRGLPRMVDSALPVH